MSGPDTPHQPSAQSDAYAADFNFAKHYDAAKHPA